MKYTLDNTVNIGKPVIVYLNGAQVDGVIEADTGDGYVVVAKIDSNGRYKISDCGEEFVYETLRGAVTVEPV